MLAAGTRMFKFDWHIKTNAIVVLLTKLHFDATKNLLRRIEILLLESWSCPSFLGSVGKPQR